MSAELRRSALVVVALAATYVALRGVLSVGTVLFALALAIGLRLLLTAAEGPSGGDRPDDRERPHVLAGLRFLLVASVDLVEGSFTVALDALTPRSRARPALVRLPMRTAVPSVLTAVAHAISASPGSVTLDVHRDPPALDVHIMRLDDAAAVREHAGHLEELAARALGVPLVAPADQGAHAQEGER